MTTKKMTQTIAIVSFNIPTHPILHSGDANPVPNRHPRRRPPPPPSSPPTPHGAPNSPLAPLMLPNPKGQAGFCMSLAMALHFFGYEFTHGSNMALFTSSTLGFGSTTRKYYPLAMACVSPLSMMLLLGYGRQLEQKGPRKALRNSTLLCILTLGLSGVAVALMQGSIAVTDLATLMVGQLILSQVVVSALFVFQNNLQFPFLQQKQWIIHYEMSWRSWSMFCSILEVDLWEKNDCRICKSIW